MVNFEINESKVSDAEVTSVLSACGKIYVVINHVNGKAFSVSVPNTRAGGCLNASMSVMCSLIRLGLTAGTSLEHIIKALKDQSCDHGRFDAQCCYSALSQALELFLEHWQTVEKKDIQQNSLPEINQLVK